MGIKLATPTLFAEASSEMGEWVAVKKPFLKREIGGERMRNVKIGHTEEHSSSVEL